MMTRINVMDFFHYKAIEGVDILGAFKHCHDYEETTKEGEVVVRKGDYDPFKGHLFNDRVPGKSYFDENYDPEGAAVSVVEKLMPRDEKSFGKLILRVIGPTPSGYECHSIPLKADSKAEARRGIHGDLQLFGSKEDWSKSTERVSAFEVVTLHLPGFGWLVASVYPGVTATPFMQAYPDAKEGDTFAASDLTDEQRGRVNLV